MRVVDRRFRQLFGQGGEFAAVVAGDRAKYAGKAFAVLRASPCATACALRLGIFKICR